MWAIFPTVFSVGLVCGIFHSTIAAILSIATISFFSLAAFRRAGMPPNVLWGSYPTVGKSDLENYTFCYHCSKPKSPRTHHCRSCGKCILDMDHHCPFVSFHHLLIWKFQPSNFCWFLVLLFHIVFGQLDISEKCNPFFYLSVFSWFKFLFTCSSIIKYYSIYLTKTISYVCNVLKIPSWSRFYVAYFLGGFIHI